MEKLEAIILEEFGAAWCDAYEKTMREFQAQGRELSEADQHVLIDFQSQASDRAQENLATVRACMAMRSEGGRVLIHS